MAREPEFELFPGLVADAATARKAVATKRAGKSGDNLIEVMPLAGVDHPLAYRLPPHLEGKAQPGCLVRVPLRHGSLLGIVERLGTDQDVPDSRIKNVFELVFPEPILTPDLLALAKWIAAYYLAPLETVFETMIPAPVRAGISDAHGAFSPGRAGSN